MSQKRLRVGVFESEPQHYVWRTAFLALKTICIDVQLISSVLTAAIQPSDSVSHIYINVYIYTHTHILSHIVFHYGFS